MQYHNYIFDVYNKQNRLKSVDNWASNGYLKSTCNIDTMLWVSESTVAKWPPLWQRGSPLAIDINGCVCAAAILESPSDQFWPFWAVTTAENARLLCCFWMFQRKKLSRSCLTIFYFLIFFILYHKYTSGICNKPNRLQIGWKFSELWWF